MARIFFRFKKNELLDESLEKALSHKYIRRIPKLTGKGWNYIYKETFQKPIQALKELFGITEKRVDNDYEKNNIQKDYGVDKKTFAAHILEFFTNKTKWTNLFSKKEAQQKYKKPVKQEDVNKKASEKGSEKPGNKDNKKGEKKSFINRSLMRKVWTIYSSEGKAVAAEEETEKAKEISVKKENEEKNKETKENRNTNIINKIQGEYEKNVVGIAVNEAISEKKIYERNDTPWGIIDENLERKINRYKQSGAENGDTGNGLYSEIVKKLEAYREAIRPEKILSDDRMNECNPEKSKEFEDANYSEQLTSKDGIETLSTEDMDSIAASVEDTVKNLLERLEMTNSTLQRVNGELVDSILFQNDWRKDCAEKGDIKASVTAAFTIDMLKWCADKITNGSSLKNIKDEATSLKQIKGMINVAYMAAKQKESEAEAHQNRSEAMMGNQNAKKDFSEAIDKEFKDFRTSTTVETAEGRDLLNCINTILHPAEEVKKDRYDLLLEAKNILDETIKICDENKDNLNEMGNKLGDLSQKYQKDYEKYSWNRENNTEKTKASYLSNLCKYAIYTVGEPKTFNDLKKLSEEFNNRLNNVNQEEENGETNTERNGLSDNPRDLRSGESEGNGGEDVPETGDGGNGNEFVQLPREPRVGPGGTGTSSWGESGTGRLSKKEAKEIRAQCLDLLSSKTDEEMTEEDKALLRQYEGAGGLHEGGQTDAAVLSEFYTPRDVIAKVWELVDKYNPDPNKKVIEPSSGIGRFAENRGEKFTLCELDETSARIARILHPEAEVKQGAFQTMFMKNNSVQKEYTGEKFDVAIGNPPYGKYEGLYKGMGEGKIHTRYEEYFIDRTLDTLKDGGIMAFVVPSGFLRGKNSKAKEAIAKKGKLLEAWRLPKGTFSSTDVGTDIVVIQKGKGDEKDFCDNGYFAENESHVIGHETDGGNWGTKIIDLPEGKTVAEAIQMIDPNAVAFEKAVQDTVKNVEVTEEKLTDKKLEELESEAEKHENRSEAMMGNQNAKKDFSEALTETIKKTGRKSEPMEAFLRHYQGMIYPEKKMMKQRDSMLSEGKEIIDKVLKICDETKGHAIERQRRFLDEVWQKYSDDYGKYTAWQKEHWKEGEGEEYLAGSRAGYLNNLCGYLAKILEHEKNTEELKEFSKDLEDNLKSEAMKGNDNAKKDIHKEVIKKIKKGDIYEESTGKNLNASEFNKKYSKDIPQEDMKFWKVTDWEGKIDYDKLSEEDKKELSKNERFVKDTDGKYMSVANYASGNIADKLSSLESHKKDMSDDEYKTKKALLEAALPAKKSVEQFTISPLSNFAYDFKDENNVNLRSQFLRWAGFERSYSWSNKSGIYFNENESPISLSDLDEGMDPEDIYNYIIGKPVRSESRNKEDKAMMKELAERRKRARRETTERLFQQFLRQLPNDEKKKLEDAWNKKYNSMVNPDYTKIPLFVEGMNENKGKKKFDMTEQQIKGVTSLCNKGNGILAYDVGVGKTVTGIVATVNQIQTGKAKKPLICVPKSVYKKWVKEIHQHFPEVEVNELGNFGKDLDNFRDENGKINLPENCLNICTYEALQKVTFKEETLQGELRDDMLDSQSRHDFDEDGNLIPDTRSEREQSMENERIMKLLGVSASTNGYDGVYWEDLGIDHITVDELHNFKNIFSSPRVFGHSERQTMENTKGEAVANEYSGLGGASSARGMKLFAISQIIQRETDGKGVFGLSATPFNNSPVEIYNILSLVARNRLKELNIYNLSDFLKEFAELKPDWKVKPNGDVENELVMKNFKNLGALQNLITEYIDKVDGEEAGVVRPYKRVHKPELDLTPLQRLIIGAETQRMMDSDPSDPSTAANTLIAMNNMRLATLSPSLIDKKFYEDYEKFDPEGWHVPTAKDVVKESPKLQFVCDMASKQFTDRPKEGQVIYMPAGKDHFEDVRAYLEEKGVPKDAVAFIRGGMSDDAKEVIMHDFNDPNGKIKIIIGSSNISEGVSLNGNSTTIYNTMLGWNPTETTQVEGRIWRQGNKQGVTHIVYPLMNDSIDSMMYQKYDEKSSRLNALWSYKGDSLNVEDINPEEMKFELIKDPERRADLKIKQDTAELNQELKFQNASYDHIVKRQDELRDSKRDIERYKGNSERTEREIDKYRATFKAAEEELKAEMKKGEKADASLIGSLNDKVKNAKTETEYYENQLKIAKKNLKDSQSKYDSAFDFLKKQGVSDPTDKDSVQAKLNEISSLRASINDQINNIEHKRSEIVAEEAEKIRKQQASEKHYSVQDRVDYYTGLVANDLRDFAAVKSGIKAMRDMTASEIQGVIDEVKSKGSAKVADDTVTEREIKDLEKLKAQAKVQKSWCFFDKTGRLWFRKSAFQKSMKPRKREASLWDLPF